VRGLGRRRGVNLIVSALLISILIFSIQLYTFRLSGDEPSSPYSILSDYLLHLKQGSRHAVTASLVNISQGGSTTVLSENMERWGDFVKADYRFGLINMTHTLHNQTPYSDGVWLDWGVNGTGVSSVVVDFDLDLSGRGVESDLSFPVNVTTSLGVSGDWLPSGLGYKWVIVDIALRDDEGYSLGSDFLVEYENSVWLDASSAPAYIWNDYGNGTYRCEFNITHPGGLVRVRTQVYDRREIFVQAEIRLPSEILDQLTTDSVKGTTPDIIQIAGDVYALAYAGDDDDGWLKTVNITSDGQIGDSVLDSLEFDPVKGKTADVIPIEDDVYAVAYSGDGDDGILITVSIQPDGQIGGSALYLLEYDPTKGKTPALIHVSGSVYALAYATDDDEGILLTIEITKNMEN